METSRFVEISDEELNEFIEGRQNPNTKKKTAYDVELFKRFIQTSSPGLLDTTSLQFMFTNFMQASARKA